MVLAAPELWGSWTGRRDCTLLLLAVQTDLRVSEFVGLDCEDLTLDPSAPSAHCYGKGSEDRLAPLGKQATAILRSWLLRERAGGLSDRWARLLSPCASGALPPQHVAHSWAHSFLPLKRRACWG